MSGDLFGSDKKLEERAIDLIRPLLPPDTRVRVERAVKEFSPAVREHIRTETGLKLSDRETRSSVPVSVAEGFPVSVARLVDQRPDPTFWRLMLAQPKLAAMVDGAEALLKDWEHYETWEKLPENIRGCTPELQTTVTVGKTLVGLAAAEQVLDEVKEINEDILGVYWFGRRAPKVGIYWMAIGLFAGALEVRVEDLTIVTLAHELVHAYSHVGLDIDRRGWGDLGFRNSDLDVIEGLAQFYTCVIAEKLNARAPGVSAAYARLLKVQSGPYTAHTEWFEGDPSRRGEVVRLAMLLARTEGTVSSQVWLRMLGQAKRQLRKP